MIVAPANRNALGMCSKSDRRSRIHQALGTDVYNGASAPPATLQRAGPHNLLRLLRLAQQTKPRAVASTSGFTVVHMT